MPRQKAILNKGPNTTCDAGRLGIPQFVQRGAKLNENARSTEKQCYESKDARQNSGRRLLGALQHGLNGERSFVADHRAELLQKLGLGARCAKDQCANSHDQNHQRRKRENAVKGERGAHARCFVTVPLSKGFFEQVQVSFHTPIALCPPSFTTR
jgi:hypothetical protein